MKPKIKEGDGKLKKLSRPLFIPIAEEPFYKKIDIEFESPGLDTFENKQESIASLHKEFKKKYPKSDVLEISTKSLQQEGVQLSAFNLMKYEKPLHKRVAVENIYQASKRFSQYGPYIDLFYTSPKEAKLDERIARSGKITSYVYQGEVFPIEPKYLFFDYIYISALYENPQLILEINKYNAFSDIEFDPVIGTNCQAATVARFKGMLICDLDIPAILAEIKATKSVPNYGIFKCSF